MRCASTRARSSVAAKIVALDTTSQSTTGCGRDPTGARTILKVAVEILYCPT